MVYEQQRPTGIGGDLFKVIDQISHLLIVFTDASAAGDGSQRVDHDHSARVPFNVSQQFIQLVFGQSKPL